MVIMNNKLALVFAFMLVAGLLILVSSAINIVIGIRINVNRPHPGEEIPLWAGIAIALAHILSLFLKIVLIVLGTVSIAVGTLLIIASMKINSGEPGRVRTWSIIGIVLSVIVLVVTSFFIAQGVFYIGFLLGFIGSILGLISGLAGLMWKPI
ncbi:MAG: hypothetical protein QXE81_01670 [Desulfurococcaceae archaeon]